MLLTLTPNLALDRTLIAPGFRRADVCRVEEVRLAAGGKGVNVARVAGELGQAARICGPLGGDTGRAVAELAAAEGLEAAWCWLRAGETRTCTILIDPAARDDMAVNERGPALAGADWGTLARIARAEAARADLLACCGSLPPGVPPEAYTRLLSELLADGRRVLLDTSGAVLRQSLDLPLDLVKVNGDELGEALGLPIATPAQALEAAAAVRARGPQLVVVTLGRQGAVALGDVGGYHAAAPPIDALSSVGSGDALLAGFAVGLLRGASLPEALRLGVACGTVNAANIGGGIVTRAAVEALVPHVVVWSAGTEASPYTGPRL
jgi:1-phosphofructokinase family hexose kinase